MRIGGIAPAFLTPASGPGSSTSLSAFQRFSQYRLTNTRLLGLRRNVLDALRVVRGSPLNEVTTQALTINGASMGLDLVGSRTSITSTEQANAAATSIADRQPEWGTSDPLVILDGTYTGGADATLTFEARSKTDVVGTNKDLKIRVTGDGTSEDVQVGNNYVPGTPITLANGMTIAVGAGTLEKNDTFTVDVSATTGSAVVRSNPFDGEGDSDAVLQDGFAITTGSFTINGTTIAVNASDTLDQVLDRINTAGLGVTAAYDEATEKVTITDDDIGPDPLTLANDTSGFLAAFKLDGASATVGKDPDDTLAIDQVSAFSAVLSGTITVNGTAVAVDVTTDTIEDVVAALDAVVDVSASLDGDKLVISSDVAGEAITLADTTGLLAVAGITVGEHAPQESGAGLPLTVARNLAGSVRDIARSLDALLTDQLPGPAAASKVSRLRGAIATVFKEVFEEEDDAFRALGMAFDFSTDRTRGVGHSASAERRLAVLLDEGDPDTIRALLGDGDDEPGLLARLDELTKQNVASFERTLGNRIDVLA